MSPLRWVFLIVIILLLLLAFEVYFGKTKSIIWVKSMLAPIPATKLNEVVEYFGVPCFKDLSSFSKIGKKKAELKRAMQSLLSKDPVTAHTGLGIIFIYENQVKLAINEFRLAYEKSNFGVNQAMHYANALFVIGNFNKANEVYVEIINSNRNDQEKFEKIVKRFSEFGFFNELDKVIELSYVSREMPLSSRIAIREGLKIKTHLEKFKIPLDFYRGVRLAVDKVFYHYFSFPSQMTYITYIESDSITDVLDIDSTLFNDPISSISQMNSDLQDLLIDIYDDFGIHLGSDQDITTAYFNLV